MIDMEWKWCESIGSQTHFETSNFDLSSTNLTLDFKGQISKKKHIPGIGETIDMEWKWCESIGSQTHFETFNFDLSSTNLTLDFKFQISKKLSQEWKGRLIWDERGVIQ